MGLEDFERELEQSKTERQHRKRSRSPGDDDRSRHRHGHNHRHLKDDSRHDPDRERSRRHRHKRSRRDEDREGSSERPSQRRGEAVEVQKERDLTEEDSGAKRDSWMDAPSTLDIDYMQAKRKRSPPSKHVAATGTDYKIQLSKYEINHQLKDGGEAAEVPVELDKSAQHEVDYTFGDAGSHWRMTRLRATYRQAEETKRPLEEIAIERYGDLRSFDEAREEEIELDRRERYGEGYVGKEQPSGELFKERKLISGVRENRALPSDDESEDEFEAAQGVVQKTEDNTATTAPLDQTALNKLKAQMMKAKLKGGQQAVDLEKQFNQALSVSANRTQPEVVVLNKMESRMLAGGRKGVVNSIDNKRGLERGLVEENEDMSIEDMVRHEKRTRGQYGGEGKAFAERIAKDAKFDNDLDYMDENATKLSKCVHKSDINLRNTAIGDYQKMKHILDTCPLCYHEDTSTPPQAPLVSLATRTYLTLPTSPEITPYGLCATIVPTQHRLNLLECDDDEWEEIRNFMKSLSRFYYAQKPRYGVVFYENAAHEGRKRHASLEAIPLPLGLSEEAPAFFREAILTADEEWTQHRKVIDTQAKANDGLGKLAFRRSMVSELPYFHVWFTLDGGMGHVVEDVRRWPKGDLFAREILGGMLDVSAQVVKKQGRWKKGDPDMEKRMRSFRKGWESFDWTKVLLEAQ